MPEVKPKAEPQHVTVTDLYNERIHGITFTLIERALGAKIYSNARDVELRLNFEGNVKLVRLSLDELKEFRDSVDFMYRVAQEKEAAGL